MSKYAGSTSLRLAVHLDPLFVPCATRRLLHKTSNPQNSCPHILAIASVLLQFVSTGYVDSVRRVTRASSCMSTTLGECLNVGGTQNMDIVRLGMSVFMPTRKRGKLNVQIIREAFASLVCTLCMMFGVE